MKEDYLEILQQNRQLHWKWKVGCNNVQRSSVQKRSRYLSGCRFGNWSPCYANQATALGWSGPRLATHGDLLSVWTTCSTSKAQNRTAPLNTHLTCWAWPWTVIITARWMKLRSILELFYSSTYKKKKRFRINHVYVHLCNPWKKQYVHCLKHQGYNWQRDLLHNIFQDVKYYQC